MQFFYLQARDNRPKPVNDVYEMHPGVTFKENLLLNDIELNAPGGDIKLVNLDSTNCSCGELDLAPNGNFEFKPEPGWYTNPLAVGDCSIYFIIYILYFLFIIIIIFYFLFIFLFLF